jgi:hypothetical protein
MLILLRIEALRRMPTKWRTIDLDSKDSVHRMRIRLIIYAMIVALALDAGLLDARYLKMLLRMAQYGGEHIGAEVDNGISRQIPRTVPGFRPPNA